MQRRGWARSRREKEQLNFHSCFFSISVACSRRPRRESTHTHARNPCAPCRLPPLLCALLRRRRAPRLAWPLPPPRAAAPLPPSSPPSRLKPPTSGRYRTRTSSSRLPTARRPCSSCAWRRRPARCAGRVGRAIEGGETRETPSARVCVVPVAGASNAGVRCPSPAAPSTSTGRSGRPDANGMSPSGQELAGDLPRDGVITLPPCRPSRRCRWLAPTAVCEDTSRPPPLTSHAIATHTKTHVQEFKGSDFAWTRKKVRFCCAACRCAKTRHTPPPSRR